MTRSRCAALIAAVALLSLGCGYAENVTPAIKDCVANETCSVQQTAVVTTTPKNPLKATAVGVGGPKIVRYDVSGNDSKGSTLKDVVVIDDRTVTPLGVDKTNGSGNGTTSSPNVIALAGKTNVTSTVTIHPVTTVTTNITGTSNTTTEFTSVSPPKDLFENSAKVVRFVPYKYCHCDLIVSIYLIVFCTHKPPRKLDLQLYNR